MNPKDEALKLSLRKLFSQNYFCISTINNLLELTNTIPDKDTLQILRSIHCVNYSEMNVEFRQWLFETTIKLFNSDGFKLQDIDTMKPFFSQLKSLEIK